MENKYGKMTLFQELVGFCWDRIDGLRLRSHQFLFVEPPVVLQLPRDSYRNPAWLGNAWNLQRKTTKKNLQITSNLDGKHTISLGLLGLPWVYHVHGNNINTKTQVWQYLKIASSKWIHQSLSLYDSIRSATYHEWIQMVTKNWLKCDPKFSEFSFFLPLF